MQTAKDIITFIGRQRVMDTFGTTMRRVTQCEQHNEIPASWYDALEALAGRPLPRSVFTFKQVDAK